MNIYQWIAGHLPRKLQYYAAIQVIAYTTCGKYDDTCVPTYPAMDAVKRFGDDHGI
jgi:hypothetical protein